MTRLASRFLDGVYVRLLPIGWLTLVWVLLWGRWSIANALVGIALALAATTFLPLPTIALGRGRLHPWGLLRFAATFVTDLFGASFLVAWQAIRPGPPMRSSIVAVHLRHDAEMHIAVTAQFISLVPGSLVAEIDTARVILYVHVLGATTDEDIAAFRATVFALEGRIIRAIGTPEEIAALETDTPPSSPGGAA
jgi:multicomponent Na+:H+ antiporter subunit E